MAIRFAVTGVERSGTTWLAQVLDSDPSVEVHHEPAPLRAWDAQVFGMAQAGTLDAAAFAKARYNYWRNTAPQNGDRAEVNSVIRYTAAAVRDTWDIPVAAVVRDGRLTVRSLYQRGTFQRQGMPGFEPPGELAGDAFAACCWYWAEGYKRLSRQAVPVFCLEDLNRDWSEVECLCEFLNVAIRFEQWQRFAMRPVNASLPDGGLPEWDEQQAAAFERWAGDVQARFGYEGVN